MTNLPAVRAPEFPPSFTWHNTSAPLLMRALRGKVVLLDFWTHGCINCQHVLPDLEKLARKYLHALVVIGVHTAKFENEADSQSVRHAIERLGITHPVVVDEKRRLWSEYAVRAWPTFVLIDASGKIIAQLSGEGHFEQLDSLIAHATSDAKTRQILDESPQVLADAPQVLENALRYPGKILAHENDIFIADSGHNRIVVARFSGESEAQVLAIAGSGARGFRDGAFEDAAFDSPQGIALHIAAGGAQTLFVADTANHAIRAIDLRNRAVSTVAGTGIQANFGAIGGAALEAELSSPWDLALRENTLFVAMAGAHQIWALDLRAQIIAPWAGSGPEARRDGPLLQAMLAQPSGLALAREKLFFADAESSSIRFADLKSQRIETLSGGDFDGPGLFTFGDRDGPREQVLLQHPLAVAADERGPNLQVLVADTYNHKIKSIAPDGSVRTIAGQARGASDGEIPLFDEPSGLSLRGSDLLIADTNNHAIKVLNLDTNRARTLLLHGLDAPLGEEKQAPEINLLPRVAIKPQSVVQVLVEIVLPAGHHLSEDSAPSIQLELEDLVGSHRIVAQEPNFGADAAHPALGFGLEIGAEGSGTLQVSMSISYCSDAAGVCKWALVRRRVGFEAQAWGVDEVKLRLEVERAGPERQTVNRRLGA